MSHLLSQTIRQHVRQSAPFHDHVEQFVAHDAGLTVRCQVSGAEMLGVALTRLELVDQSAKNVTTSQLAARAARLCERVTYLLEPLQVIELDSRSKTAPIRSKQPRKQGKVLSYYELLSVADQGLTLSRYSFDPDAGMRTVVEFVLTPDQLELLLDDMIFNTGLVLN